MISLKEATAIAKRAVSFNINKVTEYGDYFIFWTDDEKAMHSIGGEYTPVVIEKETGNALSMFPYILQHDNTEVGEYDV